jgi:hypothetical protein
MLNQKVAIITGGSSGTGVSPTNKRDKERLRESWLREEEQDRIIRIIKGIKK